MHNSATIRWLANRLYNRFHKSDASLDDIMAELDAIASDIEKRKRWHRMLDDDGEPTSEALRIADDASARLEYGED